MLEIQEPTCWIQRLSVSKDLWDYGKQTAVK